MDIAPIPEPGETRSPVSPAYYFVLGMPSIERFGITGKFSHPDKDRHVIIKVFFLNLSCS